MIIAAQGLLNHTRYPSDDEIRLALDDNLCRCGVYERVRRAIKLRTGRPASETIYEVVEAVDSANSDGITINSDELPVSLRKNPELDDWIRIDAQNTITVFTGKAEIGQGIKTAVAQIAAAELMVAMTRIRVISADTGQTPDEGITAGSMSLQTTGNAVRCAAAEARAVLLAVAFEELEALSPPDSLIVQDGTILDPLSGREITYWELFGRKKFHRRLTRRSASQRREGPQLIGAPLKRIDLLNKVTGKASFVHDLQLPGMVHGRVVRPPIYGARLVSVAEDAVNHIPGILKIVRDGSFLAVIAGREYPAVQAWRALHAAAVWAEQNEGSLPADVPDHLLTQETGSYLIVEGTAVPDPVPPLKKPEDPHHTLQAVYTRPYQMHGSLGPSAAVAQFQDGNLTVWSHTQGVFLLQETIAQILEIRPDKVRVIHTEGSGCYGHNGADDAALDAALLARSMPGTPISVKWMREDEHTWEPYGPAMVVKLQAGLGNNGEIAAWNHDVWSYPHSGRPRPTPDSSGLLASWHLERPWPPPQPKFNMGSHFGSYRNADPLYTLLDKRVVAHFVPDSPLRTSSMRGLGAYANIFAIESFMDELSSHIGADPVDFRLSHLRDERAKSVITAVAEKAQWQPQLLPSRRGQGRGIAFARYKNMQCYCAIIVDLFVDEKTGQVDLQRVFIAADAGQIVNPDGLSNQLEGGFMQSASWTLLEEVTYDHRRIRSRDWDSYPILRFSAAPEIETVLINRPQSPFLGSGEAAQGPAAAAIANAIFDALGIRFRDLPITNEKILQALERARHNP